VAMAFERV